MSRKLWSEKVRLHPLAERFTVGDDPELDLELVEADVRTNLAHARMLKKIGILSAAELAKLRGGLRSIERLHRKGRFAIRREDEDVHTAIENHLTKKLGTPGKKIHTARSRNDQVLTDLRLHSKTRLLSIVRGTCAFGEALLRLAERHRDLPLAGYTHMRKAMPSSVGLWAAGYVEGLAEDLRLLWSAYDLCDVSPLGTGSGFGLPIRLDRKLTARLLGFSRVYRSATAAQLSRGKVEAAVLFALQAVAADVARFASDLLLFTTEEFGFFRLPGNLLTGSSLMPQKRNPDVLELARAHASRVRAALYEVIDVTAKLPSGYQRDLQLTKRPLLSAFATAGDLVAIAALVAGNLRPDPARIRKAMTEELHATGRVLKMASGGIPFREAYRRVAADPRGEISGRVNGPEPSAVRSLRAELRSGASRAKGLDRKLHTAWRAL